MMKELFSLYLQAGIFGSILIAVILIARLFLRQAPRRILCVVWLLAVLRLLVPFQIESAFSLQPKQLSFSTVQQETIIPSANPNAPLETPQTGEQETVTAPEQSPAVDYFLIASIVWGVVACGFVLYGITSYLIFKTKVADAIRQPNGTKECANINNAFLIGLFYPVIYLPTNLTPQEQEWISAHEKAHIAHGDNWWKVLSFLCLCLHWYNPLVWLCFYFFNTDIEIACDEKVIRNLDIESRKDYSMALLRFGKRSGVPSLPSSSFGKVNLKQRLVYILSYRKPRLWISVVAVLLTVMIAICFLTSPRQKGTNPQLSLQASGTPVETQPDTVPEKPTEDTQTTPNESTEAGEETTPTAESEPPASSVTELPALQVTEPEAPVVVLPNLSSSDTGKFDMEAVDINATNYAAGLGFQTLDSHPNSNVACFTASTMTTYCHTQSQLQDLAYREVDKAYQYCIREQYPVTSSVLWVNISYNGYMGIYVIGVYCAT